MPAILLGGYELCNANNILKLNLSCGCLGSLHCLALKSLTIFMAQVDGQGTVNDHSKHAQAQCHMGLGSNRNSFSKPGCLWPLLLCIWCRSIGMQIQTHRFGEDARE